MFCNYQNTNDYCLNQYSYQFIGAISNNGIVTIDKSETAPVLRTDKTTGATKIITSFSTDLIKPCNINDDNETITEWECYTIYRYIGSGYISDPSIETLKNGQIDIINNAYELSLMDGVQVSINNTNTILGSNIEDQIYYQSILNYAQVLYDDDSNAVMPSFTDSQNKVYSVSYDTLISIFKIYFNKVIYYKNLKESLVSQCLSSENISDLQTLDWCSTKVPSSNLKSTKIITSVQKPVILSCEPHLAACYSGQFYEILVEDISTELIKGSSIFDSLSSCYTRCGQDACSNMPSGWNCSSSFGAGMTYASNVESVSNLFGGIDQFYNYWFSQASTIAIAMIQQGYINVKVQYSNYTPDAIYVTSFSDGISRPLNIDIKGECPGTMEGITDNNIIIPDYLTDGVLGPLPLGFHSASSPYFSSPYWDRYIRRCNHS